MSNKSYFGGALAGLKTLLTGMDITMGEYMTRKVTEQYPENRKTQHIAERHRGTLVMVLDENGKNKPMDVRYILLTMPEVDDDRYDVLKDGVKACYEECKARMEVLNRKADAKFAELTIGDTDEDVEKLKAAREKLNDQWYGHRDKLYNEKLQEIEEAHNKWLAERDEKERKRMEDEATHNDDVALSMRMTPEED